MTKSRLVISYVIIAVLLITASLLCIFVGTTKIDISEITKAGSVSNSIVLNIRIPRMLAAIFAGGALSVSGYCLQTFFHNPIAGPYLLGISSGAKLFVAAVMIFIAEKLSVLSNVALILAAFLGAMSAMAFVIIISKRVRSMSMLLVCGVMIGYICTAICDLIVTFAEDSDIVNLHNWSRGSLSKVLMDQAIIMGVVITIAAISVFLLSKPMSAFLVSESYAKSVGVNINSFKIKLVILSSLLSACVTAFAGPVSFVGIAVPHLVRKLISNSKPKYMIPACFFLGAVFTCICDLLSRTLFAPTELSISTVTAIFGSPVVIYMMIKRSKDR